MEAKSQTRAGYLRRVQKRLQVALLCLLDGFRVLVPILTDPIRSQGGRLRFFVCVLSLNAFLLASAHPLGMRTRLHAQEVRALQVRESPSLQRFLGRPIEAVRVKMLGSLWHEDVELTSVRPADLFSPELVRRGLRELEATGRFAEAEVAVAEGAEGVIVTYSVRPRRLVAQLRFEGGPLDTSQLRRALGLGPDDELTDRVLAQAVAKAKKAYLQAGFPEARVRIAADETDDPLRMLVRLEIKPGPPERVEHVRFRVAPSPHHPELGRYLSGFGLGEGARMDRRRIEDAVQELQKELIEAGFYEARVSAERTARGVLTVSVHSGPRFSVRIEGAEHFSSDELAARLALDENPDPRPDVLGARLREHYAKVGFLDAMVRFERRESADGLRAELFGWVREGERFSVRQRLYPCAGDTRTEKELDAEVDGVLTEQFPSIAVASPPNSRALDAALGTTTTPARAVPLPRAPYSSYSEQAYQAVRSHLEDLYRSEAYLGAEVGPVTLVRRRCAPVSRPSECVVSGPPPLPAVDCSAAPADRETVRQTCVPDPARGVRCEPTGVAVIPVHPGRQAILYDVSLSGNVRYTESELLDIAEFPVGDPARPEDIDAGLQRIQEHYADEAFAFALVDSELELSPDGTRARLVVSINERERVKVSRIEIQGATRTREGLIRSRLSFAAGDFLKRPAILRSQERIESLGVFTSVAIAMEDPGIPAKEKVVVVTVAERLPQYVDIRGGFATADGFRIGFEYGHRNLGGSAIQLLVRSHLGLRPVFLIPEADVRAKYANLVREKGLGSLLERRNTLSLSFPDIGLGPLFRLEVELLDVLDNNRDFGQTKEVGLVQLTHRPNRQLLFYLGATVEYNDAEIFGTEEQIRSLEEYVRDNPNLGNTVRVPQGQTVAWTQHLRGSWDRRDRQLAALRGTYLGLGVEHVSALPVGENEGVEDTGDPSAEESSAFSASQSEFLRYSGRIAGYVPLGPEGLTLALSLRSGIIDHLTQDSRTYPDRLFFVGGVDTIRGYPQDSLVPQDLADRVLDPTDDLTISDVVLRGGDFFINPRAELRIPLGGSFQTAFFLDSGNLWADPGQVDLTRLRYAVGTGIRVGTPVGPLVFDYGFNLEQLLAELDLDSGMARSWEDIGAFHFSIGLF